MVTTREPLADLAAFRDREAPEGDLQPRVCHA